MKAFIVGRKWHSLFMAWIGLSLLHSVSAQSWKAKGEFVLTGGQEWNVYHSPETYFTQNDSAWIRDSLIFNDALVEPSMQLTARKRDDSGRWRFSVDGYMRRYGRARDANRTGLQIRGQRVHHLGSELNLIAEGRLRQERRLGTNILGNELLTAFSFFQAQANLELEWRPHPGLICRGGGEAYLKDYQSRMTGVSLDQDERSFETEVAWNPNKVNRDGQELVMGGVRRFASKIQWSASYEFRDKPYRDWVNQDLLAEVVLPTDTTPFLPFDTTLVGTYPIRRWMYSTWRLRCDIPLKSGWFWSCDLRRQSRKDNSRGDFGFEDAKVSLKLKFAPEESAWAATVTTSQTWRDYTDRLAEQAFGTPYPTLKYRYTRLNGEINRTVGQQGEILVLVDAAIRASNTTAQDRRTRRGYRTGTVLIGYRLSF